MADLVVSGLAVVLDATATTTDLVTLAEAYSTLNIRNATDQTNVAPELATLITAVSHRIADECGDVIATTYTNELHDGGNTALFLRHTPIYAVATVTEYQATTGTALATETNAAIDGNRYLLVNNGYHRAKLVRRSGGYDTSWWAGRNNIAVTYQSGRVTTTALVSSKFKEAALVMVSHLWHATGAQGDAQRRAAAEAGIPYGTPSFSLPRAVKELLSRELRPPYLGGGK